MNRLSILIVSHNSAEHLQACLAAILAELAPGDEIIAVDNASTDTSAAAIRNFDGAVRLIVSAVNRGFAGANNLAAADAHGDILVMLNPDAMVRPGWRSALVDAFQDPTIGVVGCLGYYPDGRLQHAGGFVDPATALAFHVGDGEPDQGQYTAVVDRDYVSGFSLAARRTLWDRLHGLEASFFPAYFEEIDFCYRARKWGARVVVAPRATVTHAHRVSQGPDGRIGPVFIDMQRWRFALRHFTPSTLRLVAEADSRRLLAASDPASIGALIAVYAEVRDLWPLICVARQDDTTLGGAVIAAEAAKVQADLDALFVQAVRFSAGSVGVRQASASALRLAVRALPQPPTALPVPGNRFRDRVARWLLKPYLDPPGAAWSTYLRGLHRILDALVDEVETQSPVDRA